MADGIIKRTYKDCTIECETYTENFERITHSGKQVVYNPEGVHNYMDWERIEEEDKEITECVVYFTPCDKWLEFSRDERRGKVDPDKTKLYGFDWMRKAYKDDYAQYWDGDLSEGETVKAINKPRTDITFSKLEAEYDPVTIAWKKGKKYYTPWLAIAVGQTIRLTVKMDWNKKEPVEFKWDPKAAEYFTLPDAASLKKTTSEQEIKITCIKALDTEQQIQLLADNQIAGKINVVPNATARKLNVSWCVAGFDEKGNQIADLLANVKFDQIKKTLKTLGLDQILIDVNVDARPNEIDLADRKVGTVPADKKPKYEPFDLDRYINLTKPWKIEGNTGESGVIKDTNGFKTALFNACKERAPKIDESDLTLVFVKLKAINGKFDSKKQVFTGSGNYISGIAERFGGKYVVIFDDFKEKVMLHEVLHDLGLYHSFDKQAPHSFAAYTTDNMMDYVMGGEATDDRKTIWKWQWERVWNHLKK